MTRRPMASTSIAKVQAKPSTRTTRSMPTDGSQDTSSRTTPPSRTRGKSSAMRTKPASAITAASIDPALRAWVGNTEPMALPSIGRRMTKKRDIAAQCRIRPPSLSLNSQPFLPCTRTIVPAISGTKSRAIQHLQMPSSNSTPSLISSPRKRESPSSLAPALVVARGRVARTVGRRTLRMTKAAEMRARALMRGEGEGGAVAETGAADSIDPSEPRILAGLDAALLEDWAESSPTLQGKVLHRITMSGGPGDRACVKEGRPAASQEPFDRQHRNQRYDQALPESRARLRFVNDLLAPGVLDPAQPAVRSQAHFVGTARDATRERVADRLGEFRGVNDEAHFGVEPGRPRIEIERADEDARAVDRERLRVQAGR